MKGNKPKQDWMEEPMMYIKTDLEKMYKEGFEKGKSQARKEFIEMIRKKIMKWKGEDCVIYLGSLIKQVGEKK